MPEVSEDAAFLIATSFQAFGRIEATGKFIQLTNKTIPCDKLVAVVFLGFYLEATLDKIIIGMNKNETNIITDLGVRGHLGLFHKLAWFYYYCGCAKCKMGEKMKQYKIDYSKKINKEGNRSVVNRKLERKFQGFRMIYEFRNDIAHGDLSSAIIRINKASTSDIGQLRTKAKAITDKLIEIAHKAGFTNIEKIINYSDATEYYDIKSCI